MYVTITGHTESEQLDEDTQEVRAEVNAILEKIELVNEHGDVIIEDTQPGA